MLFSPLAEVGIALRDLRCAGGNAGGDAANLLNHVQQVGHRGVYGIPQLGKLALEITFHLLPQVAFCQRGDHPASLLDGHHNRAHQLIDSLAKCFHEALVAVGVDALVQLAYGCVRDQRLDLVLGIKLQGNILPFNGGTKTIAAVVDHRVGDQLKGAASDLDPCPVGVGHARQQFALVFRVFVEYVDVRAQQLVGGKLGEVLAQIVLGVPHHLLDRLVQVNNVSVVVGHHHVGGHVVQRDLDALRGIALAARLVEIETELDLHRLQGTQHVAYFVTAMNIDAIIEITLGDLAEMPDHAFQRLQNSSFHGQVQHGEQHQQCAAHAACKRRHVVGTVVYRVVDSPAGKGKNQRGNGNHGRELLAQSELAHGGEQPADAPLWLQRRLAGVEIPVQGFGFLDLLTGRTGSHRHVFDHVAVLAHRRDVGFHPVVVAVLATILDEPRPRPARLHMRPQILESRRRHVRVADDIVILAQQLVIHETADFLEIVVSVCNSALEVGLRHDGLTVFHLDFVVGDW